MLMGRQKGSRGFAIPVWMALPWREAFKPRQAPDRAIRPASRNKSDVDAEETSLPKTEKLSRPQFA